MRPSEYTAALIQALRLDSSRVRGASVLEVGCGSGVVLAALGAMGAASLCGVDIEQAAIAASASLLESLGQGDVTELHRGDMWRPVAGRRFDLVVANLPHFPMEPSEVAGRLPSWSAGGADGRRLLDPFLDGLRDHLAPGGRAVITHNAFDDLDRSRALAAKNGLSLRVVLTTLVYIAPGKLAHMTAEVLRAGEGCTIHRHGPYAFGEMHIVEIAASGAPA
jgi:release factor glutamine methyltransferase